MLASKICARQSGTESLDIGDVVRGRERAATARSQSPLSVNVALVGSRDQRLPTVYSPTSRTCQVTTEQERPHVTRDRRFFVMSGPLMKGLSKAVQRVVRRPARRMGVRALARGVRRRGPWCRRRRRRCTSSRTRRRTDGPRPRASPSPRRRRSWRGRARATTCALTTSITAETRAGE